MFCKKGVLRSSQSSQRLQPATLLKKRLWHRLFPVNFAKFVGTPFLKEHLRWLFLFFQLLMLLDKRYRLEKYFVGRITKQLCGRSNSQIRSEMFGCKTGQTSYALTFHQFIGFMQLNLIIQLTQQLAPFHCIPSIVYHGRKDLHFCYRVLSIGRFRIPFRYHQRK